MSMLDDRFGLTAPTLVQVCTDAIDAVDLVVEDNGWKLELRAREGILFQETEN